MELTPLLANLAPDTKQLCDREFNRQLDSTDGNVFIFPEETFQGIKLTSPNEAGLQVLYYFADLGCPISMARLCVALHPAVGAQWPIMCSSHSLEWFEHTVRALDSTVYDPLFSNVYEAFVNGALNAELMAVLNISYDGLNEDIAVLDITSQARNGGVSLFCPRGDFVRVYLGT
ncbi:hypothetical protein MTsDn1_19470 [Alteromonas sp. MTD1]|uniref:hypothetical protein n=1 Tax=Alteromonas sp. MTD1 TaxID=3057962 RepID=UPI0036F29771